MDYAQFSSGDFICDELFQNWIIKPDKETDEFWNEWLSQHPDKLGTVEEAKSLLLYLTFIEDFPTDEQVQNSLETILSKINSVNEQNKSKKNGLMSILRLKQFIKIAAIFIIIAVATSIVIYNYLTEKTIISTKYGEIKKAALPYGSSVVLNAHSTISFYKHTLKSRPRQVWLDGEALFDVKHINKNLKDIKESERFIVSTTDLNIQVLGTSFNVKKRTKVTEVVLQTGRIRI